MTVKELSDTLQGLDGELPVIVRARWTGEAPAHDEFEPKFCTEELERDTGDHQVVIECQQ